MRQSNIFRPLMAFGIIIISSNSSSITSLKMQKHLLSELHVMQLANKQIEYRIKSIWETDLTEKMLRFD